MQIAKFAILLGLLATPALAATDPMASFYSTTLTITDRGTGNASLLQINSDNTFVANISQNGHAVQVTGTWALQSDQTTVCLTSQSVGVGPTSATAGCVAMGGHVAGDDWTATNDQNQSLELQLSGQ